jgi:hypothetical protein
VTVGRRSKKRKAKQAIASPSGVRFNRSWGLILFAFFALSLVPRLYGGLTFGADLDGPGTFTTINYDEAGGCRAVLGRFVYPSFIGHQTLAIAKLLGQSPPAPPINNRQARGYCYSRPLTVIHRSYSAVTGALTVVLVGLLALMMWPARPQIAWTACTLLGFSNLHVAQSHWGTADAPQVFFIYLFTTVLVYGLVSEKRWPLFLSPLFLIGAVWAKWYVFAVCAYVAILPQLDLKRNWWKYALGLAVVVALAVRAIGWGEITDVITRRSYLLWGNETGRFGTSYGNIGTWRRWIRNATNLPIVHIVGLGLPACLFVWNGLKHAWSERANRLAWLAHAPALAYVAYMLVLGTVTYYRHYLPLFPTVCLLAALGLWESRWSTSKLFLAFFLLYPILLTVDSEYSYRADPRRELRSWYAAQGGDPRTYFTYYTQPPRSARNASLFNIDGYLRYGARYLDAKDYLILSENWYDTSYPNEMNGPIAWKAEWLIKTKPEYVVAYRRILSGQDPKLEPETEFNLNHFMPEFLVHRFFYGSFQLFVGDIKIYRIIHDNSGRAAPER